MAFTCDSCRTRHRTRPHSTSTGRSLCDRCHTSLLGAAAGVLAAGGEASTSDQVVGAIATAGWYARIRTALGRR